MRVNKLIALHRRRSIPLVQPISTTFLLRGSSIHGMSEGSQSFQTLGAYRLPGQSCPALDERPTDQHQEIETAGSLKTTRVVMPSARKRSNESPAPGYLIQLREGQLHSENQRSHSVRELTDGQGSHAQHKGLIGRYNGNLQTARAVMPIRQQDGRTRKRRPGLFERSAQHGDAET